jgi:hypothetical protein
MHDLTMRAGTARDDGHVCSVCHRHLAPDGDFHPACLAEGAAQDAIVALLAAAALMLFPLIVVWAG